jgi:hypothetical protein
MVAKKAATGGFPAKAWAGKPLFGPWYFACGCSTDPEHRKTETTTHVRCIVIDDVGTKVDAARITAPPTWKLETSEGNFQWGYLFAWTAELREHDALNAALVSAGLQDKGAQGVARLSRLPGSVNNKPGRGDWKAQLVEVNWSRVYTIKSLAAALGLELGKLAKPRVKREPVAGVEELGDDVFDWLQAGGHVVREKTDGWFEIVCPFAGEHTGDQREDAAYRPVWAGDGTGRGVKCFHSHGEPYAAYRDRFLAWVKASGGPEDKPPMVAIPMHVIESLRKITPKAPPKAPPKAQDRPLAASTRAAATTLPPYTLVTLCEALCPAPGRRMRLDEFPFVDRTKDGFSKLQPVTYGNVDFGLRSLGVKPRLNLMKGTTDYILPERIDMARFGSKTREEIVKMVDSVLADIFAHTGFRNEQKVMDCIARIANTTFWHPMNDWILAKPWDGQDRFGALLATVHTPTPDLFRVVFRRWLLQGIEAACGWEIRRESQKGLVLVLVGGQELGKSNWLKALAPGFSVGGKHLNVTSRDSIHEVLRGVIVELGELDSTFGKNEVGQLKSFITQDTDEYRLPYGKDWLTRPRCTSLCASVNVHRFLNDTSGTRRFAPVEVVSPGKDAKGYPLPACEFEHNIDMQQLWAQVHSWWAAGEKWWLTSEETHLRQQHSVQHQQVDEVGEAIDEQVALRADRATYPIEVHLGPARLLELLGITSHPTRLARASEKMRELYGKETDRRPRGGSPRGWPWWVRGVELQGFNLTAIRPAQLQAVK